MPFEFGYAASAGSNALISPLTGDCDEHPPSVEIYNTHDTFNDPHYRAAGRLGADAGADGIRAPTTRIPAADGATTAGAAAPTAINE